MRVEMVNDILQNAADGGRDENEARWGHRTVNYVFTSCVNENALREIPDRDDLPVRMNTKKFC
jgi:hypothetical protein